MKNRSPLRPGGRLHQELHGILTRQILDGVYADGDRLPAERELARTYALSRVTVRRSLETLAREGIVSRRQGHGTRITLRAAGHPGAMETLAVLAPAANPFFGAYLGRLEAAADARGSLVVFRATGERPLPDLLANCYARGIRNAVIWPYDEPLDAAVFARLRGLGMNLVLFDRVLDTDAADCVSVDNAHAIETLVAALAGRGCRRPAYIGWRNDVITSNREREAAFLKTGSAVYRLPWKREQDTEADVDAILDTVDTACDGILCGNGQIGLAVKRRLPLRNRRFPVVCVDDLPGADALALTAYAQPLEDLADTTYERLAAQNRKRGWKARTVLCRGVLKLREGV